MVAVEGFVGVDCVEYATEEESLGRFAYLLTCAIWRSFVRNAMGWLALFFYISDFKSSFPEWVA